MMTPRTPSIKSNWIVYIKSGLNNAWPPKKVATKNNNNKKKGHINISFDRL